MKPPLYFTLPSWLVLLIFALSGLVARAESILQIAKTTSRTTAVISNDIITFRLSYSCTSLTKNANNAVLADLLDSKLEVISTSTSSHIKNVTVVGNLVAFRFHPQLPAGATGDVSIQARFKASTPVGYKANNAATILAINSDIVTSNTVSVTAEAAPTTGGPTIIYDRKLIIDKQVPGQVLQNNGIADYYIYHGLTYPTGETVNNYNVLDSLPAGLAVEWWASDYFPGTNVNVSVFYKTNYNSAWRSWVSNPRANTGSRRGYVYPSELSLGSGEYVSGLKFSYGNLPGGPGFHRSNCNQPIVIRTRYVGALATVGTLLENCADATAASATAARSCGGQRTQVEAPRPIFHVYFDGRTPGGSLTWNEEFEQKITVATDSLSNTPLVNPNVGVLLPEGFDFVSYMDLVSPSPVPAPTVTAEPNFDNTGRTMVRMKWSAAGGNAYSLAPLLSAWSYIQVRLKLKVGNSVANGTYAYQGYSENTTNGQHYGWNDTDRLDFDKDGNRTETHGFTQAYLPILVNNGAASMTARMEVQGDLDSAPKMNPDAALTTPAGAADYTLRIKNESGIVFNGLQLLDILPHVGDKGVIDPSARGTTFEPFLAGPITAPGATVRYSLSKNPCRTDFVSSGPVGCEPPNWSSTPPADITRVKSVLLDFGTTKIQPNQEIVVGWPMRVPLGAPSGATDVAWNSFGMVATRMDDNTRLLPSEPQRTGVKVQPPVPPFLGDQVWLDTNGDGKQDTGETGINGLRVELYADNGDGVADPNADRLVKFSATYREGSADGKFLFANFPPGKYFVVVYVPNTLGITIPNVGADDSVDSDGEANQLAGGRVAVSAVTDIELGEEDRSWDFGLVDRTGQPAVWASVPLSDGKVIIGGRFASAGGVPRKNVAMLLSSGAPDLGFNPGAGFNGDVLSLAVHSGKVVAGGNFTTFNNTARNGLSILNTNGTIGDAIPQPDTADVRWVDASSGSIYVAGGFTKLGGVPRKGIARLSSSGALDAAFDSSNGADAAVNVGAVQSDGSIIIAGKFTSYNGTPCGRIIKLKPSGAVDTSFNAGSGADGEIMAMKQLTDGRLVLTGRFGTFNGGRCRNTARLYPDGRSDMSMSDNDLEVNSINTAN